MSIDIKQTFLDMTDHLYPHGAIGSEAKKVKDFQKRAKRLYELLPKDLIEDEYGNLYKLILPKNEDGSKGKTTVMFTSHLDTATSADGPVKHVIEGDFIKTNGKTILGADDKAGTVIQMYMMENNIPGLYYFFLGEEVGCYGSKWLGRKLEEKKWDGKSLFKDIDKVISFDRKDYNSVISYQRTRTASDKFTDALAKALNQQDKSFKYETDPTGSYTDSARVSHIFPECTNVSVGYFGQHTKKEKQNIKFLEKLCKACVKLEWEKLPVKRNPKTDNESRYSTNTTTSYNRRNNHSSYNYNSNNRTNKKTTPEYSTKTIFDSKFRGINEFHYENDVLKFVDLVKPRVEFESKLIKEVLEQLDIAYKEFSWDGLVLTIKDEENTKQQIGRVELYEFLPEIDYKEEG